MIKELIEKWEEKKHMLEDYFVATAMDEYLSYLDILRKTIELCFSDCNFDEFCCPIDYDEITEINDGHYQGSLVFVFHREAYQPCPEDYLWTCVDYGSCSGCDTLQNIIEYSGDPDGKLSREQVKQLMTLALHMVQKIKWLVRRGEE